MNVQIMTTCKVKLIIHCMKQLIQKSILFLNSFNFFFFMQTQMTGKKLRYTCKISFNNRLLIKLQSMRIKQIHHIIFTFLLVITSTISIPTGWKNLKRLSFTFTFYIKSYAIKKKICLL